MATTLTAMLPNTSSDPAIAIGHVSPLTSSLLVSLSNQSMSVTSTRTRIADLAAEVQNVHAEALETAIRVLEQTVYGSVARGVRARAEHLNAVAKGLDMKVRILAKNDHLFGSEELVEAVRTYDAQLEISLKELDQEVVKIKQELEGYENAGRPMDQIADRYAQLLKKKGDLAKEVDRLKVMPI